VTGLALRFLDDLTANSRANTTSTERPRLELTFTFIKRPDGVRVLAGRSLAQSLENGNTRRDRQEDGDLPQFLDEIAQKISAPSGAALKSAPLAIAAPAPSPAVPQDGIEALIRRAEAGEGKAQGELGKAYFEGKLIPKDWDKAFLWFKKAADQNDAAGLNGMGIFYGLGSPVPKDSAKAAEYYQKAVDLGYPAAHRNLAMAYINGTGVSKDTGRGIQLLQKAADMGHPMSQLSLGLIYVNGTGVPKDESLGMGLIQKASDLGEASAQYLVGIANLNGDYHLPKNLKQAAVLLERAAVQDYPAAQMQLGLMYSTGQGVDKDLDKAFQWMFKAASKGNVQAENNLATFYANGWGTARDNKEAIKWALKAGQDGSKESAAYLVEVYEKGLLGESRDATKAEYWKGRLQAIQAR